MINIPLCISLSIASGATPLMGLLTGVWAWVMAAIFCSSKHNVYGPAGSLAGILLPIALTYGVHFVPLLAIWWWLVIVLFAALNLTKYISLVPGAALQWFLLGIWLIIGLQQVPWALWLDLSYTFTQAIFALWEINFVAFGIFLWAIVILQLFKRYIPSIPGAVAVTVLWVIVGRYFGPWNNLQLDLLVDKYTDVSFSLFQFFDWSSIALVFQDITMLKIFVTASFGVWIIAILETLISSKIAAKETRDPYDSQKEIYGLWVTNILSGVVGWLPASALVVRTGMNISNGATSKLSWWLVGIFTAIFSLFLFSNALQFLPFAVIAAILIDVAFGMINVSLYHKMRKLEKASIVVILFVWVISYAWDPLMWVLIGAIMSLLVFVKRMMASTLMVNVFRDGHHFIKTPLDSYDHIQHEGDIVLIKLEWELNYLSVEWFIDWMKKIDVASTIILGFGHTANIDIDAQEELEHMIIEWRSRNKTVYITGLHEQSLHMMEHGVVYQELLDGGYIADSKSALLDKLLS